MKIAVFIAFLIMFLITVGAGVYAASYGKAELYHFWVAFPAGNVTSTTTLRGAGPPITISPVNIDLDQRGLLKNWLQPGVEGLSTHWIYNLGTKPVRVKMELVNLTIPVKWEVNANMDYDPVTHTFKERLMPGQSIKNLGIDWLFYIPPYYLDEQVIYDGGLKIIDADTNATLTFIPIKIGRGGVSSGGADCCS
ncbi:MAG: hypothetical protein NO516_03460 [Candidatus Methanomethylicia archaeon]|nr:hypothetical protein [Candidatus Methanomethylicia archaeon]